jgi:LPXTG-site transpeptidase (sortase) family protein
MTGIRSSLAALLARSPVSPRRAFLIGVPVLAVLALAIIIALRITTGGGGDDTQVVVPATPTARSAGMLPETVDQQLGREDLANRQAEGISGTNPDAPVPGAEGDRLIIPSIGVDAPMTMRVVTTDANGAAKMENPEGPTDVAWYDFSAFTGLGGRPGVGGNTVISGHVDYHDYGPAVFWDLRNLEAGSEITVHLRDGSEYKYTVQWNRTVEPSSTAWNEIVASTSQESLTMITCAGTFDSSTRSYDQRRVVWAIRTG